MTYRRAPAPPYHRPAYLAGFLSVVAVALALQGMPRSEARALAGVEVVPDTVTSVVDGDTLAMASGLTVRVLGVDTPETVHPDMDGPQPYGPEATARTAALVEGRAVALQFDVTPADHYGRALRHVWVEGRLLSEILVVEGLGRHTSIPPDLGYASRLAAAEAEARAAGRGIWSRSGATPLSVFR